MWKVSTWPSPSTAAIVVLLTLTLGACGDSAVSPVAAGSEPAPVGTVGGQSEAPLVPVPPASTAPAALAFTKSMVRSSDVTKQAKGGQANVELVAGTNDLVMLERIGRECVAAFLREQKADFCKVFGTQADYSSRDPRQAGDSVCWAWLISVPLSGGEPVVTRGDKISYAAEHCPGNLYPVA